MARGLADFLNVQGAHALLHARGTRIGRNSLTQEVGLERHHARIHEEQRGIIKQQGR